MEANKKGAADQRKEPGGDKYEVSRGGNGRGKLVEGFLTGGEVHDATVAGELGKDTAGCAVTADRGYGSNGFRRELEGNNNLPVIPGRRK
jgi:hypothetical protein